MEYFKAESAVLRTDVCAHPVPFSFLREEILRYDLARCKLRETRKLNSWPCRAATRLRDSVTSNVYHEDRNRMIHPRCNLIVKNNLMTFLSA